MIDRKLFFIIYITATLILISQSAPGQSNVLMPQETDHTSMWWRDGFPGVIADAAWRRCIETGNYWFMLDTDTLTIPHIGPVSVPVSDLPSAELSLKMVVDGKTYFCKSGAEWTRHGGPRLIESGRVFQRADVSNLVLTADDGTKLNADARLETSAWPDQLGLALAARPGKQPITTGDASFGRVHGGFGLDGTNCLDIPAEDCITPETFTFEFWTFLSPDYLAGKHAPWLICKNAHEQADGNYGLIILQNGVPEMRMNIGGGRENAHQLAADSRHALKFDQWNHLAISYDGELLRLHCNGQIAAELKIGKKRIPQLGDLTIGDRNDKLGDGAFRFRGIVDEIRLYDHALTLAELHQHFNQPESVQETSRPIKAWTFRNDVLMSTSKVSEKWKTASIELLLKNKRGELSSRWELPEGSTWDTTEQHGTALMIDPVTFKKLAPSTDVKIEATEFGTGKNRPVTFESSPGWHRINLDGIEPIPPMGIQNPTNDAIERVKLVISNPTEHEQIARLMFEKTSRGIQQRIGTPITGMSAILRDSDGQPTGIPVQLSKNWHNHPEAGEYNGQWFHGISQLRLPPKSSTELELTIAYGHWGGVPAASHTQLCLIGWGANQLWDQSAMGSWGESICYEPDQIQGKSTITDVRPLMVTAMKTGNPWGWTHNVGGGDFFRFFDLKNERIPHSRMKTEYHRQGPCLTEVTYSGGIGKTATSHRITSSLSRSDDLICATYRISLNATETTDFSRFVIFQIAADTYATTAERKFAIGDHAGLTKEWATQGGGNIYRGESMECATTTPWASLHETEGNGKNEEVGAWANRGFIIREWKARLGGKMANPWMIERGLDVHKTHQTSTLDLVPPPGVTRLESGDFIEATIEFIVVPQFSKDYYGPNIALKDALTKDENTWKMIHRQAVGDAVEINMKVGNLERSHPDVRITTEKNIAEFTLKGGLGFVPITFTNLNSNKGFSLFIDGERLDQSVHGNDFWQTDYDSHSGKWSQTFNIPGDVNAVRTLRFAPVE